MQADDLLQKWEETYKKGLLSFWMLALLAERPSYPFEMRPLIEEISQGTITADDHSIYRALSRFQEVGIVASELRPSSLGPDRRYYRLTDMGHTLLRSFAERNIRVFETPQVAARLERICENHPSEERK